MPFVAPSIELPLVFPLAALDNVSTRVQAKRGVHPIPCQEFGAAWNAVAYRYLACTEHYEAFSSSLARAGDSPLPPERYLQERELFGFFYTGLSTIECFCYGIFVMGNILKPADFPFISDRDRRAVQPKHTLACLTNAFPVEGLTDTLRVIVEAAQFFRGSFMADYGQRACSCSDSTFMRSNIDAVPGSEAVVIFFVVHPQNFVYFASHDIIYTSTALLV